MPLLIIAAVLIGLPMLEIAIFIRVGSVIGVFPTLALTIATAVAGAVMLRRQGLRTLMQARAQMDRGIAPAREAFDGICLVLAGLLLLIPGFFTDFLGLLLFIPTVRGWLWHRVQQRVHVRGGGRFYRSGDGDVIEGEWVEVDDEPPANDNPRRLGPRGRDRP